MINLYNEDCLQAMRRMETDQYDLAIVDPPYGNNALNGSNFSKKYGINRKQNWDCYRPNKEYFIELLRVSKNQVIWGGNYFITDLLDTKCLLVFDKSNIPDNFFSMSPIETAWTSFNKPSKIFRASTNTGNKIHPTQKPVALYTWILNNYAKEGDKILDTHLGSGSIAIACHDMGFSLDGYELDTDYYESACKRLKEHQRQLKLF